MVLKAVLVHVFSFLIVLSLSVLDAGQIARHVYENMRREAASLRIQRDLRMYIARKAYKDLCYSAISIQTGMRGMAARDDLRFRRQTRAAIMIQVRYSWEINHQAQKFSPAVFGNNILFM